MIPPDLTPAQAEAIEDLLHQCDLISARPLQCEIDWAIRSAVDIT